MKKEKLIFWNVDTQYDFMRNDKSFKGALPIKGARKIEPNLRRLTNFTIKNDITIVNTADWHTPESTEFSLTPDYFETFPPHCLQHTHGAMFVPSTRDFIDCSFYWKDDWYGKKQAFEMLPDAKNIVIYKDDFDVFKGNPYTDRILKILKPATVVVYGVATNVCVNFAIKGLLKRRIEVVAVVDAMKELPGCDNTDIYKVWAKQGVQLNFTKTVIAGIEEYKKEGRIK